MTHPHTTPEAEPDVSALVLETVRQMVAELYRGRREIPQVTLDRTLDRDLGFDSLGRYELLARLEKAAGVSLSEHGFAAVETVRDLLRELGRARGRAAAATTLTAAPPARPLTAEAAAGAVPLEAATLNEVLRWHAAATPERVHIRFYRDDEGEETITFAGLLDGAGRVAAGLARQGLAPQEAVLLMLPTGKEYFFSFFGTLLAGGIPVPIYPPGNPRQIGEHLAKHAAIAENCQAQTLVTVEEATRFGRLLKTGAGPLRHVVTPASLGAGGIPSSMAPSVAPDDIAFLQYTSGSTGLPKGVILTHRNLLANIRAMGSVMGVTPRDVFVSWLPLYHDMGLIGAWLGSLYHGCELVIMSPLAFIARPERWLLAVHRHRGTLSAAPNFAYELCTRRVEEGLLGALDLSSWRVAFNGAEAVRPETLERFAARFAPCGFNREAMTPVYGLAENSVGLAFPPLDRGPRIDRVERRALAVDGRAVPALGDGAHALAFVCCGLPLPGHEIRVVDAAGRELPERREGRIQFRGPSATAGYYRNREKTAELFNGTWLDTGDLGYLAAGEVYLTGRRKDIVIRAGRNIYPEEIEQAVGEIDGVRRGYVAVFGSPDPASGTERLVVAAETRHLEGERAERLRGAVREAVTPLAGAPPDEVVLVPPNSVPRTSSGKIRRSACRDLHEGGGLGRSRAPWLQTARYVAGQVLGRLPQRLSRLGEWARHLLFWGCLGLLLPPVWLGVLLLPGEAVRWGFLHAALAVFFRLAGLRPRVTPPPRLPTGPCVYVANHASYLDSMLLAAVLPYPVSFVAKGELEESLFTRIPLARIGTAFVERFDRERSVAAAGHLLALARGGRSLIFFSEGTFTRMPGLLPFRMGAFEVAARGGLPVVPVAVRGTRSALRSGSWFFRRGPLAVTLGEPIEPEGAGAVGGEDSWETALELRDRTRSWLLAHCGEPDLARERAELLLSRAGRGPG